MNRSTVALLLSLALVVGLWLWMASATSPAPPPGESGNASVEPAAAASAALPRQESSPERSIAIPRLRCLDVLGKPVSGVAVWSVSEEGGLAAVPSDDRVSRTDAYGCVDVGRDWLQRTTFCLANGFRVARVRWDVLESRDVVLEPAASLEVFVRAAGKAVTDATVVASAHPVMGTVDLGIRSKHGLSTTLSVAAKSGVFWRTSVDGQGRALFSNLEPGNYYVAVFSDSVVPASEVGLGEVPIAVPCAPLVVEMEPVWAAVAALPPGVVRASHAAVVDTQLLAKEAGIVARTRHLTARLAEKFGTELIRVGTPNPAAVGSPPDVEFRVVDSRGGLWSGAVPMREISSIDAPIYLSKSDEAAVGRVKVAIRHARGGAYSGSLKISALGASAKKVPAVFVRDGEIHHLPVGQYGWSLGLINPWAFDPRKPQNFCEVIDGEQVEAVVTLPDLVSVTIRPRFVGDALERGMSVRLRGQGASATWLWRPEDGEIQTLVPEGQIGFRGDAAGLDTVEFERAVSLADGPLVVDLVLTVPPQPVQNR
jgi:hypothetical protein